MRRAFKRSNPVKRTVLRGLLCSVAFVAFAGYFFRASSDPCWSLPPNRANGRVPKIIHQQWATANMPVQQRAWRFRWLELFPSWEYQHVLWTDESQRELVKRDYPSFLATYDSYQTSIRRADAARVFILHRYGGVYADLDYEPLQNFWVHLPDDAPALVESRFAWNERVQNSLMSSPVGHPFWNTVVHVMMERSELEDTLDATGPRALDEARRRYPGLVHELPCAAFQRPPPAHAGSWQRLMVVIGNQRDCGRYDDSRCLFARHHQTNIWLE